MTDAPWPAPDWVLHALDDLRLGYAVRFTPRGVPYAGLTLASGPDAVDAVPVTALAEDGTLRLTAHDLGGDVPPDVLRAADLPLARAYLGESGTPEVALGVLVGHAPLPSDVVGDLLAHLVDSRRALRDPSAGLVLPPVRPVAPPPRLPTLDGVPWCRGTVAVEPDGWVVVEATHVPDLRLDGRDDVLDRLQLWTRAGQYLLDDGTVRVRVRTPVVADDLDERVAWTVSQATLMLQVARDHLPGPGA